MTSRPETAAADLSVRTAVPTCCSRPMSTIAVTDAATELTLLSCAACARHAWLQDGVVLDREGMLAAVKQRLAEAPRPKGGRPKGSGRKAPAAVRVPAPRAAADARREEVRTLLQGFTVLGEDAR